MQYKKVETYQFTLPKEYKACLDFKDELRASGIPFIEDGGMMYQTITIVVRGTFDKTEDIHPQD